MNEVAKYQLADMAGFLVIGKRNDSRARVLYVHTSHFMTFLHVASFAQLLVNGVREIAQVF